MLVKKIVDFFVAKTVPFHYRHGWKKCNPLTPYEVAEKYYDFRWNR